MLEVDETLRGDDILEGGPSDKPLGTHLRSPQTPHCAGERWI